MGRSFSDWEKIIFWWGKDQFPTGKRSFSDGKKVNLRWKKMIFQ